jgi:hypothetical protein
MLTALENEATNLSEKDRRVLKRRVMDIRAKTHELFDYVGEGLLEEPRNERHATRRVAECSSVVARGTRNFCKPIGNKERAPNARSPRNLTVA